MGLNAAKARIPAQLEPVACSEQEWSQDTS